MASYPLTRGSKSAQGADVLSDALIAILEGHNAALKANVERLEAHNAALKADIKNLKAKLAAERERADRAIRAFESQTKLEAMAEANATHVPHRRPWWVAAALFAALLFVATALRSFC
jgi:LmbE family N-acetylglucosaminyl deacetylase